MVSDVSGVCDATGDVGIVLGPKASRAALSQAFSSEVLYNTKCTSSGRPFSVSEKSLQASMAARAPSSTGQPKSPQPRAGMATA